MINEPHRKKTGFFAYAKTKVQSCEADQHHYFSSSSSKD